MPGEWETDYWLQFLGQILVKVINKLVEKVINKLVGKVVVRDF